MKRIKLLLASFVVMSLSLSVLAGCGQRAQPIERDDLTVHARGRIPEYPGTIDFDWSELPDEQDPEFFEWSEKFMYRLLSLNLVSEDDVKVPSRAISRGEFIDWIVRAKEYELISSGHSFNDVPRGHIYHDAIITAVEHGVVEADASFDPDEDLIRSDAAIWLVNAAGEKAIEKAANFDEPLIPAQDGYYEVPDEAIGALTVCYWNDFQLMYYRWRMLGDIKSDFRYIMPNDPMLVAEAAHSAYMLIYPPVRGESLTIGQSQEPKTLFSGLDQMSAMSQITELLYGGIGVSYDEQWAIHPVMVKRIPTQENGLWVVNEDENGEFQNMHVTFELRQGLKWADGAPITADDFLFSRYLSAHPAFPNIKTEVNLWQDEVEKIDDYTFRHHWNTPYLFANLLAGCMPRHYFEEKYDYHLEPYSLHDPNYYIPPSEENPDGFKSERFLADEAFILKAANDERYNTNPLHAGPYKVRRWEEGQSIILEPNEHFIFGRPLLDSVTFRTIESTDTLLASVMACNLDMTLTGLTYDQAVQLQRRTDIKVPVFTPSLTWEHIDLNVDDPVLSDLRVRRALLHAIDRESISIEFFDGKQPTAHAWLPPRHPAYDEETVHRYEYDLEKAAELLDEAGWILNERTGIREKDGQPLEITFMTTAGNRQREEVQAVIISNWRDAGIRGESRNEDATSFFTTTLRERRFDGPTATMYAWIMGPTSNMYTMSHSSMIPTRENNFSGQNYTGFKNAEVDELTETILRSMSHAENYENLKRVQEIMTYELPSLPLFYRLDISTIHRDLVNYKPSGTLAATTWNLHWWYWDRE